MKIKLNVGRVGNGIVNNPGDTIEVPDDEAARYVKSGQAEYVKDEDRGGNTRPQKNER